MPTVIYPGGMKEFPYNAPGKAQAHEYAKLMKGKIKNNPNYGMEKQNTSRLLMAKMKTGRKVCWEYGKGKYCGTLIPSMENAKNRYARTENGKIKTLPKK